MAKEKDKVNRPIVSTKGEEREEVWDEAYIKEEGIILEFDSDLNTGKIKSLLDDSIYSIDSRELIRTKIELRAGDKVYFAPMRGKGTRFLASRTTQVKEYTIALSLLKSLFKNKTQSLRVKAV